MKKNIHQTLAIIGLFLPAAALAQTTDFDFENIEDEITGDFAETDCGMAVLDFADTFQDARQGSCRTSFNGVSGFLDGVSLPGIDFGGLGVDIDFELPDGLASFIPDVADVATECDTGGCVEAITEALDMIDEKCAEGVYLSNILTPETFAKIRAVRAIVSVYCLSDAAGNLCFPTALDSFPPAAEGLFSGIDLPGIPFLPSDSRDGEDDVVTKRESLCSICSQIVQQGLFAAYDFDADANNFNMLSQLACLKDRSTKEFCEPNDLLVNGLGFVQFETVWNTIFDEEEDLCASSCATQAIGVLSPHLSDSEVFPDGCYEPMTDPLVGLFSLNGLGNLPTNLTLEELLDGDSFSFADAGSNLTLSELVSVVEDDLEAGLGLPPGSLRVNLTDVVDGVPVFEATILEDIPGVDGVTGGGGLGELIPGLPFQQANEAFGFLADPPTRSFQGAAAAGVPTSTPSSSPTKSPTMVSSPTATPVDPSSPTTTPVDPSSPSAAPVDLPTMAPDYAPTQSPVASSASATLGSVLSSVAILAVSSCFAAL
uniref:Uncharacterized protein n=1 Tax=Grammatophora oceanica TaxID=210454 RepID=A0A7S1VDJ6_9STRA|mmetsp:Transcript_42249/g.62586  ORF Transcript_42249/g.62586 Transcript_42249/m.62586 type:complete len:541 (+) Transcript_42249:161-1783(+)|eukprot:CAMPEP_0194027238 /NCGR_PEP_ID=MMETSP0009_2-20130614/1407_1 /TAXON_ID=210454 /ORGANISM="Grammatophora oceanica, Strain CCMP 410" /LENGTH=540 /DNA_ID=CAMNT_0038666219 /DNA_START=144 /DNA_END=1766 /DNA_ORIENTATION=-